MSATVRAGDDDSLWRFSLILPDKPALEETESSAPTPDGVVAIFEELWGRWNDVEPLPAELEESLLNEYPALLDN